MNFKTVSHYPCWGQPDFIRKHVAFNVHSYDMAEKVPLILASAGWHSLVEVTSPVVVEFKPL